MEVCISTPDEDAPETATLAEKAVRKPAARTEKLRPVPGVLGARYEVIDELGHGGMGVVYRARDTQLGRDVALKLVVTSNDPGDTLAARLLREAQALAQLSHPNVVAVYDVGRADGGVFVAMELVAGVAGDTWLKEKRHWRDVVRVYIDAARGLAAAHAVGLVHRDFKPANLMIGSDGRVRVLDFGLARTAVVGTGSGEFSLDSVEYDSNSTGQPTARKSDPARSGEHSVPSQRSPSLLDLQMTQAGAIVGTPPYMAPEQHLNRGSDARSDQFAFCVSLFRALYGYKPFDGKLYSELKANIINGRHKQPPADTDVPNWVRDVVLRGLSVDPDKRWSSMDAVIAALSADPAIKRRKIALVAAGAVLVAGAGITVWAMRPDPAASCRVGAQELAGTWDAARKDAVHTAFIKTGKPYAADAFASVTRVLDGYTAKWTAMRTDACLATRVRGTQSAELLDLRMECLQRRLDDVRALVDVFAAADADVVSRAAEAAGRVPPLDACADAEALRAPVRPPADPKTAAAVEAARKTLASVTALWMAGRYPEASKQLAPVVTQAHQLGWRPLEAETVLMQARLADENGEYQDAARLFKESAIAAEAGRDDYTAALARNGLVWVVGNRLGRYDEARELALDAGAKVERLGRHDLLQADLDQKVGSMMADQGNFKEAEERIRRVVAVRENELDIDAPPIASALGDLADILAQTGRYPEAIELYQRALKVAERSVGPDHTLCATLRINLGSSLRYQGKLVESRAELDKARTIVERALGAEHPQLATIAIDIGNVELDQGHTDEAAAQFRRAGEVWTRALGADHPNVGTAQFRLGEVALKQGHPDEATASFQRAYDIWQARLGKEHPSLGTALAGLGEAALAQHQPLKALGLYNRAIGLLEKALGPDSPELASTLADIARCQIALGKPKLAIAPLERALALQEKAGDTAGAAKTRSELERARNPTATPQH